MPFVGILLVGLGLVSYVPWFSNVAIKPDIAAARAKAKKDNLPPRDAWMMECVPEDPTNPMPCSADDRQNFPGGQMPVAPTPAGGAAYGERAAVAGHRAATPTSRTAATPARRSEVEGRRQAAKPPRGGGWPSRRTDPFITFAAWRLYPLRQPLEVVQRVGRLGGAAWLGRSTWRRDRRCG